MEKGFRNRKNLRLESFDYSASGAYFITICTHNRQNILSNIPQFENNVVGEGFPLPQLSKYGIIIKENINKISNVFINVSIDKYVIMPNHIHILMSVTKDGRGDPSPTINKIIGWLKYQSTKEINKINNNPKTKIFQRSFYDHVIRNEKDYCEILEYIINNPLKWQIDKYYQK